MLITETLTYSHAIPHTLQIVVCSCLQVLKELAPYKNLVVATGGGAVTRPKNWSYMHNGIVAWLQGEPDLLAKRVVAEGIEKRPLLFGDGVSGVWLMLCVCCAAVLVAPRVSACRSTVAIV